MNSSMTSFLRKFLWTQKNVIKLNDKQILSVQLPHVETAKVETIYETVHVLKAFLFTLKHA